MRENFECKNNNNNKREFVLYEIEILFVRLNKKSTFLKIKRLRNMFTKDTFRYFICNCKSNVESFCWFYA